MINWSLRFRNCWLLLGALWLLSGTVLAQNSPPSIRCISLDENDDLTVFWVIPDDVDGNFVSYDLWYSPTGLDADFSVLTSITDPLQDSVFVMGSFSGLTKVYLVTTFTDNSLAPPKDTSYVQSDTIAPIILFMNVTNDETANFTWNAIDPFLPTYADQYIMNFGDEIITLDTLDSIPVSLTSYVHTPNVLCTDILYYQITLADESGCVSRSAVKFDDFVNQDPIDELILINCVDVDTGTGEVVINWDTSALENAQGYIIFKNIQANEIAIDTLGSPLDTIFEDSNSNPQIRAEMYRMLVYDDCPLGNFFNTGASPQFFIRTLYQEPPIVDTCADRVLLQWNNTREGPVGVDTTAYLEIWRSVNNGPYEAFATLQAVDSFFVDSTLQYFNQYDYLIRAYSANDSSKAAFSNERGFNFLPPPLPQNLYLSTATVLDDATVSTELFGDETAPLNAYGLYRSLYEDGPFQLVTRMDNTSNQTTEIRDESGRPGQTSYFYQVKAINTCEEEIMTSNTLQTIHLDAKAGFGPFLNELQWNAFSGWESAGSGNEIHRLVRVVNGGEVAITESETFGNDLFEDDIENVTEVDKEICYYVEAEEAEGNEFGFQQVSRSNLACLSQPTRLYIPNAFRPNGNGRNDTFLPVLNYAEYEGYKLTIRNRLGQIIFGPASYGQGWDGGDERPGVYIYELSFRTSKGDVIERIGTVTLLK